MALWAEITDCVKKHSTTNPARDGVQKVFRITQILVRPHPSYLTRHEAKLKFTPLPGGRSRHRHITTITHQASAPTELQFT